MESASKEVTKSPCPHHSSTRFSQCASFRSIRKSILDSCQKAEEANIDDFKALLDDGEIFDMTRLESNNYGYDALADSILNSTTASNDSDSNNAVQALLNKPFVPFSVEELSLVKSLTCWSNHNIRVIGRISPTADSFSNLWLLSSIGEEGGPFSIEINFKLVNEFPVVHSTIQVFGEIQFSSDSRPVILAKFYRDLSLVDLFYFNKGLEEVKKFVPHFVIEQSQ